VFCFSLGKSDKDFKKYLNDFKFILKNNKITANYNSSILQEYLQDMSLITSYFDESFLINLESYANYDYFSIARFKIDSITNKNILNELNFFYDELQYKHKLKAYEHLKEGLEYYINGCKSSESEIFFKNCYKLLEKSVKDYKNNPASYFFMANCALFGKKDFKKALELYELTYTYAIIDLKYKNFAIYAYLIAAFLEAILHKNYQKSIKLLLNALEYNQNFIPAHLMLAKIYAINSEHQKALISIEQILELNYEYILEILLDEDLKKIKKLKDLVTSKNIELINKENSNFLKLIKEFKQCKIDCKDWKKLFSLINEILKLKEQDITINCDNLDKLLNLTLKPNLYPYKRIVKINGLINKLKNEFLNLHLDKRDLIIKRVSKLLESVTIKDSQACKELIELKDFLSSLNPGTFEDALELEKKLMNFFVEIKKIDNINAHANDVAISQEGEYLIFSTLKNKIILIGINKQIDEQKIFEGNKDVINDISINVEENVVVACSDDHTLRVWDIDSQEEIANKNFGQDLVKGISINKFTKELLALTANSKELLFLDLKTLELKRSILINRFFTKAVAISSNAKYITYANFDNSIIIYDIHHKKEVGKLIGHKSYVTALSIDYSGEYLISSSSGGEVILWNLFSQKAVKSFNYASKEIDAVAISIGGEYITNIVDNVIYVYALDFNKWQDLQIEKLKKEQEKKEEKEKQEQKEKKEQKKDSKKKNKKFINIDFKKYRSKFFKALIKYIYDNFKNVKKD
jgi:hypothetical protein